jgi:pimeloyl-ACP methyl ester carboxylesterase
MPTALAHTFTPGQSPAIVFLHGLGADGRCFEAAPRLLTGGNAILIPDLAGFGGTAAVDGFPFTMKAHAESVLALCRAKGLEKIAIVGHSMGGAVGIILAENWAGGTTHFACAVGNLVPEDCFFSRSILAQGYERFHESGFDRYKDEAARPNEKGRPAGGYRRSLDRTTAQAMFRSAQDLVALSDRGGLLARFLRLDGRKLYLKDQDTPLAPPLTSALAESATPVVEVPQSGHSLMEDNPAAFYGFLDAFLNRD